MPESEFEKAQRYPYSRPARTLNRYLYGINHKGEYCYIIKKLCQEGYCSQCEAWRLRIEGKQ